MPGAKPKVSVTLEGKSGEQKYIIHEVRLVLYIWEEIREKRLMDMFDRRTKNVNIFNDTMDWISESKKLNEAVTSSIDNQRLYLESEKVDVPEAPGKKCVTVVSTKRSFEAAAAYAREGKNG